MQSDRFERVLDDELLHSTSAREIADAVASAVRSGELQPGAALPSIRSLAATSGVSPATVSSAFAILRRRNVITTAQRRRARVTSKPALPVTRSMPLPPGTTDVSSASPDPALLPDLGRLLSDDPWRPTAYSTDIWDPALHQTMNEVLLADGVDGELTPTNGSLDAVERILSVITRPGDAVAVEDPLWSSMLSLVRVLGLETVPVAIDDRGMKPEALDSALRTRKCSAVILTPRAQNPYGSAMDADRSAELREVLDKDPSLFIIEDDHASLVAGAPMETVTTGRERWSITRSVNKALGPDLRLAVTASDIRTAEQVQGRFMVGPGWVSHFLQRLVARALSDDAVAAQMRQAEDEYTARRTRLIDQLGAHGIEAHGRSGMNVLIPVDDEAAISSHLLVAGWSVRSGAPFRLESSPFLRVSVSQMPFEDLERFAGAVAEIIGSSRNSRY